MERIFPLYLPTITKIEVVAKHHVRRAKLYYLRNYKKRLKKINLGSKKKKVNPKKKAVKKAKTSSKFKGR